MMTSFWLIGLFPVIIAEWIGVIALRRGPRGLAWGMMMVGVVVHTFSLFQPLLMAWAASHATRSGSAGSMGWIYLPLIISVTGNLLFAIGFALHGLKVASASQRQGELEQLAAAMSEEIDRLKGSSRP
jgi:hypothetical protein